LAFLIWSVRLFMSTSLPFQLTTSLTLNPAPYVMEESVYAFYCLLLRSILWFHCDSILWGDFCFVSQIWYLSFRKL
jgi:hypothetical protein